MRPVFALALATALFAAIAVATQVEAGGPGEGTTATCEVPKAGGSALRGTVAVTAHSTAPGPADVDFTLRLSRGGATAFFRFTTNAIVFAKTNEDVLCLALENPELRDQILTTFNFRPGSRLVITDRSITNAETQGPQQIIPGTDRGSTLADVTIYVQ